MEYKRITILSGHYGSGKTNIAVNMALQARKIYPRVAIADIDIVNPYFRSKDSEKLFEAADIRLICSEYANSNVDIPALPQDIYSITDDRDMYCILDVGGDERGALALGRIAPQIRAENNYDMIYVVNFYRPLTQTAAAAAAVMEEIENACGLKFSAIVNNSNLGKETSAQDILETVGLAEQLSNMCNIPILFTAAQPHLCEALQNKIDTMYPLKIQKKI